MYQILLGVILILGGGCYYLFDQNQTLIGNNAKLELAVEEQRQAIEAIRESYERQGEALNNMTRANAQIEAEKERYLEIFKRHNLNLLAIKKPMYLSYLGDHTTEVTLPSSLPLLSTDKLLKKGGRGKMSKSNLT